jgi:hypothetical protein
MSTIPNIPRHVIVKTTDEKTTVRSANKSHFVDEEVLFSALNFTVFDVLQKDNVIFEGWRDKHRNPSAHRTGYARCAAPAGSLRSAATRRLSS